MQTRDDKVKVTPTTFHQFRKLPAEMKDRVLSHLEPTSKVFLVDRYTSQLFGHEVFQKSFWKKHFKNHFPYLYQAVTLTSKPDWRQEFIKADRTEYPRLSAAEIKLFYLVKEGEVAKVIDSTLTYQQLHLIDVNGYSLVEIGRAHV